jgi:hypothetical protein
MRGKVENLTDFLTGPARVVSSFQSGFKKVGFSTWPTLRFAGGLPIMVCLMTMMVRFARRRSQSSVVVGALLSIMKPAPNFDESAG